MVEQSIKPAQSHWIGRIFTWLFGAVSFGVLALLLIALIVRFTTPVQPHKLQLVQDVLLPSIIASPNTLSPQTAALATHVDRFDFQALDPQTGLLFIAHPGPSANKLKSLPSNMPLNKSVVVFNVRTNQIVTNMDVPFVHGLAIAPDLHRVYAADADDGKLYVLDELKQAVITSFDLTQTPDSLEYDPDLHEVFVAEPIDRQGGTKGVVDVVDTQTNKIIQTIPLNNDIGHIRYDPVSHRMFAVVVNPQLQGELVAIDPIADTVSARVTLPDTCVAPHGQIVDAPQQVAFVACMNSQNLVAVDLSSMKILSDPQHLPSVGVKPDILALDHTLHTLFVASTTSITIFDEGKATQGGLHLQGDYIVSSGNTHTIAVDDTSHNVYVAVSDLGGRPMLRVEHYNPNGI
ncbi:MAG TPA: YncE family protein [Ktedonosporobacter sp.]|nr:YncE family protein [Ktedonosporobacter sp.]